MKKIFYLFLIVGLVVVSCKKASDMPTQDVVFKTSMETPSGFKADDEPICVNPVAHYAKIIIDNIEYTLDVFYLNDVIYTNTLKLDVKLAYEITSFTLWNDSDTPTDPSDDVMVQAAPMTGSTYAGWVKTSLPIYFDVAAFMKTEIEISTLCFVPNAYTSFGFAWFTVEEVIVREVCFFGDFCTKYYEDYVGTAYEKQRNGLQHDMPAIFKIKVCRTHGDITDSITTYSNEGWLGEGKPLCVKYPDYKNIEDIIKFKLYILVKVGNDFEYVEFHTFTALDDGPLKNLDPLLPPLSIGDDNVLDFVLGSCVVGSDLVLAPYMNLPATAQVELISQRDEGTQGTYFDMTLSGIGSGFDIEDGLQGGWLGGNRDEYFIPNHEYTADVYSSLYPDNVPDKYNPTVLLLDNINWLGNNLYRYPEYTPWEFQMAVWGMIEDEDNTGNSNVIKMMSDAIANGNDYLPPVGGYAAVLFVNPAPSPFAGVFMYMVFTLVDP